MIFYLGFVFLAVFLIGLVVSLIVPDPRVESIGFGATATGFFAFLVSWALIGFTQLVTSGHSDDVPCETGLAALTNTTATEGSFSVFLGIGGGSFGETQNIVYMTEDANGGIQLGTLPAKDSVIYEDGQQSMKCRVDVNTIDISWAWPFGEPKTSTWDTGVREFHVPEGSVQRDFSVVLNNG